MRFMSVRHLHGYWCQYWITPFRSAATIACWRVATPNFCLARSRYVFAVFSLIERISPISHSDLPAAYHCRHSRSRGENGGTFDGSVRVRESFRTTAWV